MAIVRAQEALSFTLRGNYHVFLSFRGEDTRKTFTGHLYAALSSAGLRIFRDDKGIERCENVNSELEKAIKAARSSIIVFSKGYASSKWCLDELVMILEHKRESEHVILPVFYDVVPSEVRHQTGSFAKAFGKHEGLFMTETNERKREYLRNKVLAWRKALREVSNLAGMDLHNDANGHESKLIKKIIEVIGAKVKALEVSKIFEVEQLCDWESLAPFSGHAFKQDHLVEGYFNQSEEVARNCRGLPLDLENLNSSLTGKNLVIRDIALQKLEAIPYSQIMEELRINYDSLQDDHTRRLFHYIALLLMIIEYNKLMIHQLLRDMAREIACQESPKELGKRSML